MYVKPGQGQLDRQVIAQAAQRLLKKLREATPLDSPLHVKVGRPLT